MPFSPSSRIKKYKLYELLLISILLDTELKDVLVS